MKGLTGKIEIRCRERRYCETGLRDSVSTFNAGSKRLGTKQQYNLFASDLMLPLANSIEKVFRAPSNGLARSQNL